MEIIELRRGDFIYRGAAGRGMGVLDQPTKWKPASAFGKITFADFASAREKEERAGTSAEVPAFFLVRLAAHVSNG